MIEVTQYPQGWNAIHSPVEVKLQRKDYNIQVIYFNDYGNGDSVRVQIKDYTIETSMIGQYIYINSPLYVGSFKVLDVYGQDNYYSFWIDTPYVGDCLGGFIVSDILKPYYNIDLELGYGSESVSTLITTLSFGTFYDGTAQVVLSEMLKKIIPQFPTLPLSGDAVVSECYKMFNFRIRERYTGTTGSYSYRYYFYGINAVKQNGDVNGCRMVGFEPNLTGGVITKGKFLQEFEQPIFNINEDFELSFIWQGGEIQSYPVTVKYAYLNINKVLISTESVLLSVINAGKLVRLSLSELTIPSNACYIQASVDKGDTTTRYIREGYVREGYIH